MEKFKVGDIVKACDDERYSYTSAKNEWVGKVIRIYDDGEFEAKTIKTRNGNKGVVYRLNSGYFELMKRPRTNYVLVSNQATIFFLMKMVRNMCRSVVMKNLTLKRVL